MRRLDFVMKVEKVLDETSDELVAKVVFTLNPERYEFGELGGEEGFFDKFDRSFTPWTEFEKAVPQLEGMPIHFSAPKIDDIDKYIEERKPFINAFFDEKSASYRFQDASEDFLSTLEKDKMRFVILLIDLKGSTRMSQTLDAETNAQIIQIYSQEIALLVGKFNGFVLKYVGDGLIAYFPEPNLIGMTDNALDCAACMKRMIINGINPILKERGLPELAFRIGLDSGEAIIVTMGADAVKQHKDLIGETINISAKIQARAATNQIFMGESTALASHTIWRQRINKVALSDWEYTNKATGQVYPIYALDGDT